MKELKEMDDNDEEPLDVYEMIEYLERAVEVTEE